MSDHQTRIAGGLMQTRPSTCPECGLLADNGVVVESELTRTATYCDTAGHLWSVTWLAVTS